MTILPQPLSSRVFDRLSARTYADRAAMGEAASHDIAGALRQRLKAKGAVRMIFAAAPSQADMLRALQQAPDIDWRRVTAFHMDEYIGLPNGAPERFAAWLTRHLFAALPFGEIHLIDASAEPEAEARRYAALLDTAPIDIVSLGVGVNGHIAFNDPPVADFDDPLDVKIVELDETCRQQQVDDKCFARLADVPERAITLTIPRLLRADRLFCVAPGAAKKPAIQQALLGPLSTACPASILRQHPNCALYLDRESSPDV